MTPKTLFKALKKPLQKLRIRIGKALFDRPPRPSETPLAPEHIRAILFLRQDGKIGDYIVSSFVFREIKKAAPHIRIGVICTQANRSLFDQNPHIDTVHTVKAKSTRSYCAVGRSIAGQYDVLIDPTAFLRTRDLRLIHSIAAPYNIGFAKEHYQIFNRNIPDTNQHFSEIYRQALQICGFTDIDTAYDLPEHPPTAAAVAAFLQEHGIADYTAVNFFGAANARRFTPENIAIWLQYFAQKHPQRQFILLSHPAVTPLLQQLAQTAPNCHVYPKTQTIQDNIELIRQAGRVISPDTATIHIAAGLGKPLIGLYRNEGLNYWLPYTQTPATILYYRDNINEITPENLPPDWPA